MTELEVYKEIIKSSFNLSLNMNDTFDWACADSEDVDADDVVHIVPIAMKYGVDATLLAYASVKRGYESSFKELLTDNYKAATRELKELAEDGTILFEQWYDKKQAKQDAYDFNGQVIEWDNSQLVKQQTIYRLQRFLHTSSMSYAIPSVAKLPDGTFAVGLNRNQARQRLLEKYNNVTVRKRLARAVKQAVSVESIVSRVKKFLGII
jgi:hypothetical protein